MREISDILRADFKNALASCSSHSLSSLSDKLLAGKPFPYLLNESEFFHHRFYVNENVLIPRPETEHLVDMISGTGKKYKTALDVGTGSGVIILSLVKEGVVGHGTGADISNEALQVAKINQNRLRLKGLTQFIESDRFANVTGTFDLIVSNPPYIRRKAHQDLVQKSVHAHEPHLALYLDDEDYTKWFQDFFSGVRQHLNPGGEFWMEGHEKELASQTAQLNALGFRDVKIIRDYSGLDRFISCCL